MSRVGSLLDALPNEQVRGLPWESPSFHPRRSMLEDLMTSYPVTIGPNEPVQRAAQLMDDFNVGALPVCHGSRIVGLVTDRDITVRATAVGLNPNLTPVHRVMSSPVRCCAMHQALPEVLGLMSSMQIRRVPVVDRDQELVGMVSLGDIVERFPDNSVDVLRSISTPAMPDRLAMPPPSRPFEEPLRSSRVHRVGGSVTTGPRAGSAR